MSVLALVLLPFVILCSASIGWMLGRGWQKQFGDKPFRWWKLR